MSRALSNAERATLAWGDPPPRFVRVLAEACDRSSQRAVGGRLGRSSGWISRVILRRLGAAYDEAEQLIMARLGEARVDCPVVREAIPLAACVRIRRRRRRPSGALGLAFARACPDCPRNTDRAEKRATPMQED